MDTVDSTVEGFVLAGLEIAKRATDRVGECVPTMFVVHGHKPDWARPVALHHPRDYAEAARRLDAAQIVLVWSHMYIDDEDPENTRLLQVFAGVINLKGVSQALIGAKQQRWSDERKWTTPSVLEGPLPLEPEWVM